MKKIVSVLLLFFLVFPSIVLGESDNSLSEEEGLILALVHPHVQEAVHQYYGRPKTFELSDVSIVQVEESDCSYCFHVTVQLKMNIGEELESVDVMIFAVNKGKVVPIEYERKKGTSQS